MAFRLGILMKSPPPLGGAQVDDFTQGFSKGTISKTKFGEENGGGQGGPDPRGRSPVENTTQEIKTLDLVQLPQFFLMIPWFSMGIIRKIQTLGENRAFLITLSARR